MDRLQFFLAALLVLYLYLALMDYGSQRHSAFVGLLLLTCVVLSALDQAARCQCPVLISVLLMTVIVLAAVEVGEFIAFCIRLGRSDPE